MWRRLGRELWGFVFWTHERGGLRYDIMVGLILAFIFLTPRGFFKDRPAPPAGQQIVVLDDGGYQLDARLLARETHNLEDGARRLINAYTGKQVKILRIEPVQDSSGRVEAYQAWIEEK
jgi:hypothetical protein